MTGSWTGLSNLAPTGISNLVLLSDGTIISPETSAKLSPNANGSYVNGTWSTIANINLQRLYDGTNVLTDGRVVVLGGNYTGPNYTSTYSNAGEIFNPLTNSWSNIPNFPEQYFGYGDTAMLPDGRVLAGSIVGPATYIFNPATNAWSSGPTRLDNDGHTREQWIKLQDGSILQINVRNNRGHAQRLDPATNAWIDSGMAPIELQDPAGDTGFGPGVLLPDGRVFFIGLGPNTAIYTPATTPGGTGTWASGPAIPGGYKGGQTPAAVLPNGKVLFAAGHPTDYWNGGMKIFEFDPTAPLASSMTDVTPNFIGNTPPHVTRFLVIPTGQVLFQLAGSQLYTYTPDGPPQTAWKPAVTNVVAGVGSTYTLTGTQLNGLTVGSVQGMSLIENDTNYPIVQLTAADGKVYYARSFNWSSTGVATGSTPVSTQFSLPSSIPLGNYSLRVVANGIASDPVSFTGGTASANDIYAWDITAENRKQGNKQEARISVVVHRDSNANGQSGSSDAVLNNVNVTLQLRNSSGTLIGTASGTTNNQGVFTSSWFSNLANGTYVAEVTALARSGYTWNKVLDPTPNDTDLDGDNLPDQAFPVPAGAAMSLLSKAETPATTTSVKTAGVSSTPQASSSSSVSKLNASAIDQVISSLSENRTRRLRLGTSNTVSLDDFFAVL